MHVLIAGGSGFLGQLLTQKFKNEGKKVTILSRTPEKTKLIADTKVLAWDGKDMENCSQTLEPVDAIINLCGQSIAGSGLVPKRWTQANKKEIYSSRVDSTKSLVKWALQSDNPPKIFIQQSGIDFYQLGKKATEKSPQGEHFLAKLSEDWEKEIKKLNNNIRSIILRTAPVIHPHTPPLSQMILSTKCLSGSILGDGTQYFSWIHPDDYTNIVSKFTNESSHTGIYNLSSPNPVTYTELMHHLGKILKRPIWLKIPKKIIELILGEVSTLALDSREVLPEKLINENYHFSYPKIEDALKQLLTN